MIFQGWTLFRCRATRKCGAYTTLLVSALLLAGSNAHSQVRFETTSVYHHIQVADESGIRTLRFDNVEESRMSLANPLAGHFEYTEMFHLSWLWCSNITNVLMVGLGGASTQRSFEHYYTNTQIDTIEIDPVVLRVAKEYFHFQESPRQRVFVEDGRVFLRRSEKKFDAIFMDAYSENRYGAFLPQHLVTKEFFALASSHLTTNGVLAYNVMGSLQGWQSDLIGAMYHTLTTVFPQVYVFPCTSSRNIVFIATRSPERASFITLARRSDFLTSRGVVTLPTFRARLSSIYLYPPPTALLAPVLTDDYAPVERLLTGVNRENQTSQ